MVCIIIIIFITIVILLPFGFFSIINFFLFPRQIREEKKKQLQSEGIFFKCMHRQ